MREYTTSRRRESMVPDGVTCLAPAFFKLSTTSLPRWNNSFVAATRLMPSSDWRSAINLSTGVIFSPLAGDNDVAQVKAVRTSKRHMAVPLGGMIHVQKEDGPAGRWDWSATL